MAPLAANLFGGTYMFQTNGWVPVQIMSAPGAKKATTLKGSGDSFYQPKSKSKISMPYQHQLCILNYFTQYF